MLRYDQHPSRHRDDIAQRQAMLDTIVDYRFFAPHKIAADERCARELDRVAQDRNGAGSPAAAGGQGLGALRHFVGAALIAAGTRLQQNPTAKVEPRPGL